MEWFERDFDHPAYFDIYQDKEAEAAWEGAGLTALLRLHSLVLDLPCGWGRLRPALEGAGYRVVGGDLSRLNLDRHQRQFPGPIVRLDLRRLPFRSRCADAVLCAYTSWGYFATRQENQAQLEEFARVLRPGGVLILDLAGRNQLLASVDRTGPRWHWVAGRYRERVRFSPDGTRVLAERIIQGVRFRHDIWVPNDAQVRAALEQAGLALDQAFGGVDGSPWSEQADRWIFRALRT